MRGYEFKLATWFRNLKKKQELGIKKIVWSRSKISKIFLIFSPMLEIDQFYSTSYMYTGNSEKSFIFD